jgi:hypothetical protein
MRIDLPVAGIAMHAVTIADWSSSHAALVATARLSGNLHLPGLTGCESLDTNLPTLGTGNCGRMGEL